MIFFCHSSFSQSNLSYAKSETPYVSPPTKEILQLLNNREQLYYKNRDLCNEIENILIEELQSLKIDSKNILYREGLERNIETIRKMKTKGNYADYSLQIVDIVDDVKKNNLLYEDEEVTSSFGQNEAIKCDDLMRFIKEEGTSYQNVSHITLYDSSWLYEVKSYKYKDNIFVIATIKKDDLSYRKTDYIFCNISEQRWKAFYDPYNFQDRRSYGEKFNDFIIDKVCNCE